MLLPRIVLAAALTLAASAVLAHPLPRAAVPAPNAILTASPSEIRITFSEDLVAAFSGLELKDAAGKSVEIGAASVDPNNAKELVSPVGSKLGAGTYIVQWHAVGADTHHLSGHYSFQVKP